MREAFFWFISVWWEIKSSSTPESIDTTVVEQPPTVKFKVAEEIFGYFLNIRRSQTSETAFLPPPTAHG